MIAYPKLKTPRCILDEISNQSIGTLQEIFDDGLTKRYLIELYDLLNGTNGIERFLAYFENESTGILWGIYLDKTLIGFIALMDLSDKPVLFYAMHPDYRHQGYMKESLFVIVKFLSEQKLCNNIQSEVYKSNEDSIKLLNELEFKIEETTEKKYVFRKAIQV